MNLQVLKHVNDGFNSYNWKDATKARQLINQALQSASSGNTSAVRPFLIQIFSLLPKDEIPGGTLK
jgi:molecular chaperone DnaK